MITFILSKKTGLIVAIIILLTFLLFSVVKSSISSSSDAPLMHVALKILLTKDTDNNLIVKDLKLEEIYPLKYSKDLSDSFYKINIVDPKGKLLYEGKVANKVGIFTDTIPSVTPIPYKVVSVDEYLLLLPYYNQAKEVIIFDEQNKEKLKIPLKEYNLSLGPARNLCGNGICDANENLFTCFSDCKFYINIFKKTVTENLVP